MSFYQNLTKNLTKRQKTLALIITLLFFVIILYSISTLVYRSGKTKTVIRIAPNSATVTLNDTKISNNSTVWLEPGDYHLKASFNEHFNTYERDIKISDDSVELYATLSAVDQEGRDYINQHRQEYAVVEGLIGNLQNTEGARIKEKYPILNHLPINNSLYSISYTYNDKKEPIINVKTTPEFIDTVVEKIKTYKDVNMESLNINFLNKNSYENFQQNPDIDIESFLRTGFNLDKKHTIKKIKKINNYYYTTISIDDYKNSINYAHYRVLIKKDKNEEWKIVSTPQPILTIYNTPKVNKSILRTINSY